MREVKGICTEGNMAIGRSKMRLVDVIENYMWREGVSEEDA